jgi:hypothetical protein
VNRHSPVLGVLETGAVIDPAVDRTASSADLLLLAGVYEQCRPGRRSQPVFISREVLWLNSAAACSSLEPGQRPQDREARA